MRVQEPALQAKFGSQSALPLHAGVMQWPAWQVVAALVPFSLPTTVQSSSLVHPDSQRWTGALSSDPRIRAQGSSTQICGAGPASAQSPSALQVLVTSSDGPPQLVSSMPGAWQWPPGPPAAWHWSDVEQPEAAVVVVPVVGVGPAFAVLPAAPPVAVAMGVAMGVAEPPPPVEPGADVATSPHAAAAARKERARKIRVRIAATCARDAPLRGSGKNRCASGNGDVSKLAIHDSAIAVDVRMPRMMGAIVSRGGANAQRGCSRG
jgi:hypothetical protein